MRIMLGFKVIAIFVIVLACRTYGFSEYSSNSEEVDYDYLVPDADEGVVIGRPCEILSSTSGYIVDTEYARSFDKCWKIQVPPDTYTRVNLERFSFRSSDCNHVYIHISVPNKYLENKYCPGMTNWNTLMAFDDFTIRFVMNNHYSDNKASFSLKYYSESILCAQSNSFTCSTGLCIPKNKVCDGIKDCKNGNDELGCEIGIYAAEGVSSTRQKAIDWMINKRSLTSGWQENTHRAIIALNLATDGNFTETDIEKELMVKQLEVQSLVAMLRNKTDEISVNQLSMFVNALLVTCQNPRNFYGFDLVALLKDEVQASPLASIPVAYLALCNAKESLPENATMDLNSILTSDSEYPFLLDIQAVSMMALSCLSDENTNASHSQSELWDTVAKFKKLQLDDGSFGNIYTTAVITQALLSCGQENSDDWKVKSAVTHLIKHLNSSSIDFLSTYLTLPILNGKSLSDIRNTNCSGNLRYTSHDPVTDVENKLGPKMRIQYSLYIGDQKDIIHTISLRVPENITVYEVMQLAEAADSKYKFKWKQMGSKMYVYEIADITNDFEDGNFWLLYLGKDAKSISHSTESLDKTIMQNEELMVMWFKKAHISPSVSRNSTLTST